VVLSFSVPCKGKCYEPNPLGIYEKPDPYVKVILSSGKTYKSKEWDETCDSTVTIYLTVSSVSPKELQRARFEIWDADSVNDDDLCARWYGDFSQTGNRSLSSSDGSRLSYEVKK